MAVGQYGGGAVWQCGGMAVWQCGSVAVGQWGELGDGKWGVGMRQNKPTSNPWMKIVADLPTLGSLLAGCRPEVMREF